MTATSLSLFTKLTKQLSLTCAVILCLTTCTVSAENITVSPSRSALDFSFSVSSPTVHAIFQRNDYNYTSVSITGTYSGTVTRFEGRMISRAPYSGTTTDWQIIDQNPTGTSFAGTIIAHGGWYDLQVRAFAGEQQIGETIIVEQIGVGEIILVVGQSNSANHGTPPQIPRDPRVSAYNPLTGSWQHAVDPQPVATGEGGSVWPALGDLLTQRLAVPVGILSVGVGGTAALRWLPEQEDLYPRLQQAAFFLRDNSGGLRSMLWIQGTADVGAGTSTADYVSRVESIIAQARIDSNNPNLPCGIGLNVHCPGCNPTNQAAIRAGQEQIIANDPNVYAGEDMDTLGPEFRQSDNLHFIEPGLRQRAQLWYQAIIGETSIPLLPPQLLPPESSPLNATYLFDFGDPDYTSAPDWNNLTDFVDGVSANAIDHISGRTSFLDVKVTASFAGEIPSGPSSLDPGPGYPSTAYIDWFHGNDDNPNAQIIITDLQPGNHLFYDLTWFASRSWPIPIADIRETQFTVTGLNSTGGTVLLDATNNNNTTVTVFDVIPDTAGTITVDISKGPNNNNSTGAFYVGVLEINVHSPADLDSDGDVDLDDFALFSSCVTGSSIPVTVPCTACDLDHDNDVDLHDFARLQQAVWTAVSSKSRLP